MDQGFLPVWVFFLLLYILEQKKIAKDWMTLKFLMIISAFSSGFLMRTQLWWQTSKPGMSSLYLRATKTDFITLKVKVWLNLLYLFCVLPQTQSSKDRMSEWSFFMKFNIQVAVVQWLGSAIWDQLFKAWLILTNSGFSEYFYCYSFSVKGEFFIR